MKKLIPFLLLFSSVATAQSNSQHLKDSLRGVIATSQGDEKMNAYRLLASAYYAEAIADDYKKDSLFALYNEWDAEALRLENYVYQGRIRHSKLGFYFNRNEYDAVIELAPESLEYLAQKEEWFTYFYIYQLYIESFIRKGVHEKAITESQEMYDQASALGRTDGMGMALYKMAVVYGKMGRTEEDVTYSRETIRLIQGNDALLGIAAQVYYRLCAQLANLNRFDEAFVEMLEFEKTTRRYIEVSKLNDPFLWINLWETFMRLYLSTKEYDKAEIYCHKLDSITIELGGGYDHIQASISQGFARIHNDRKQYSQALEMINKAITFESDPVLLNTYLKVKVQIMCSMRGSNDIFDLFQEVITKNDSIRNLEFNAQLDELRTIYEVDKLEKENQIVTMEKMRNHTYFLFALGGCLLLTITLGIWIFYSRTVVRKNRGLYLQIREQDFLTETLEREREKSRKLQELLKSFSASHTEKEDEDEAFARLALLMKERRLYADSEIKRYDIAAQIGISDRGLHDCIKNNTGLNFAEYINSFRLSCSRDLLSHKGDKLTIDAIALEAGFSSRATFYRQFRGKYGLSPEEFRKLTK